MRNTKKYLAIALAAAMAMSGSINVFADNTTGSSTGVGSSEGHVDKHVTNVVLPTVPEGSTPFAYTVDLERLLDETDGLKYGTGIVSLPSSNDTGVYFLTAAAYGYTEDTAIQSGADVSKHYTKNTGYIAASGTSDGSTDYYAVGTATVNTGEDVTSYYVKADNGYVAATGTAVENTTYYSMTKDVAASAPNASVDVTGLFTSGDVYVAAIGISDGSTEYFTKAATNLTYANTSSPLTVTSKSSVDVNLKVEVTATKETGDITLVNAAPATKDEYALATEENGGADAANKAVANVTYYSNNTGTEVDSSTIEVGTTDVSSYYIKTVSAVTDPQLYLGLKVGSEATVAIEAGKTVSKEVTIEGKDSNFETTVKNGQYIYGEKTGATGWNTTTFSITGAASKASAKDVNVPDLTVTWSWTDPAATPEVTDDYKITINADGTASYTFVEAPDTDSTGITALSDGTSRMAAVEADNVTYEDGTLTFKKGPVDGWLKDASSVTATINGDDFTFTVVNPYTINVTAGSSATFTFPAGSAPTGTLTDLKGDTTSRTGAVANTTYEASAGTLTFAQGPVDGWLKAVSTVTCTFSSGETVILTVNVQ